MQINTLMFIPRSLHILTAKFVTAQLYIKLWKKYFKWWQQYIYKGKDASMCVVCSGAINTALFHIVKDPYGKTIGNMNRWQPGKDIFKWQGRELDRNLSISTKCKAQWKLCLKKIRHDSNLLSRNQYCYEVISANPEMEIKKRELENWRMSTFH